MRTRALSMLAALALVALLLHVAAAAGGSGDRAGTDAPPAAVAPPEVEAPSPHRTMPPQRLAERPPHPAGRTEPGDPERSLPPGARQRLDLRRRVATAAGLRRRADAGDAEAQRALADQLAAEADPRVRLALATGEQPDLGRTRFAPPLLPQAAAAAEAGTVRAYWLTPRSHDGTYESAIAIDATGRATIETEYEQPDGERWRVRYPAWAYRDAQGRLIIDARGQRVEYLQRPPYGSWSPDSMVIGRDGLIEMIDDKHDPGSGTSGAQGSG